MFGKNKIVKTQSAEEYATDKRIGIVEIFSTLQGEGPFSGVPSVFIRTKDCAIRCHFCDTEFSTGSLMSVDGVVKDVEDKLLPNAYGPPLVVITGGEPLIWRGVGALIDALFEKLDCAIQIETCGAVYSSELPWLNTNFWVVCSPKTPKLNPNIELNADAFKYIITDGEVSDEDGLPNMSTQVKGKAALIARPPEGSNIYVTPCDPHTDDDQFEKNKQQAIDSCLRFGYTFNLQLHKEIGLP